VLSDVCAGLMEELRSAQKQISELRNEVAQAQLPLLIAKAETLPSGAQLLAAQVDGMDAKSLQVCHHRGPQLCQSCLQTIAISSIMLLYGNSKLC